MFVVAVNIRERFGNPSTLRSRVGIWRRAIIPNGNVLVAHWVFIEGSRYWPEGRIIAIELHRGCLRGRGIIDDVAVRKGAALFRFDLVPHSGMSMLDEIKREIGVAGERFAGFGVLFVTRAVLRSGDSAALRDRLVKPAAWEFGRNPPRWFSESASV